MLAPQTFCLERPPPSHNHPRSNSTYTNPSPLPPPPNAYKDLTIHTPSNHIKLDTHIMAAYALAREQHWWLTIHEHIITTAIYPYKNGLYTWSYLDSDILHLEGGAYSLNIRVSSLVSALTSYIDKLGS